MMCRGKNGLRSKEIYEEADEKLIKNLVLQKTTSFSPSSDPVSTPPIGRTGGRARGREGSEDVRKSSFDRGRRKGRSAIMSKESGGELCRSRTCRPTEKRGRKFLCLLHFVKSLFTRNICQVEKVPARFLENNEAHKSIDTSFKQIAWYAVHSCGKT